MDVIADVNLEIQLIVAFAGAFSSYLFMRLLDFFSAIYEKQVSYRSMMLQLKAYLLEEVTILRANRSYIKTFFDNLEQSKRKKQIIFLPKRLAAHSLEKFYLPELVDERMQSDFFEILQTLNLLNIDYSSLTRYYEFVEFRCTSCEPPKIEEYIAQCGDIGNTLRELDEALEDSINKVVNLVSRVHLTIDKQGNPLGYNWINFLSRTKEKISDKELLQTSEKIFKHMEK